MQKLKQFFFRNTTTRQTIVKNTFWMGASTAIIKIARAAIIIYAARLIGTEQYGIFTYAMSVAAIFAVFSDMGLSTILVRELSKNTEKIKEYFSTALVIKIGFLLTTVVLILGITPLISRFDASTALMPIIALSIAFESLRSFLYSIPRAQNNMQNEAGLSIVNEVFCIILIIVVFLRNPSPATLAYSLMIGNGVGFVVAIIAVRSHLSEVKKYFVGTLVGPLIKLTIPFAILSVFGIFMTNVDSVIIGLFGNEHVLGLYGAAQRPFNILYMLPSFLTISLLPMVSKFIKEGKTETVTALTTTASQASLAVAFPLMLGGIVVAGPLISVIFGTAYIGAVSTFQILLITTIFVFPGTIFADILLAQGKQKIFIFTGILGALLNICLDFILIPRYGIMGSAIATVVAQAGVNIAFYLEAKRSFPFTILHGVYKSIIAAALMAFVAYMLTTIQCPLLIIIPLSAALYVGLLFIMKDKTIAELRRSFG